MFIPVSCCSPGLQPSVFTPLLSVLKGLSLRQKDPVVLADFRVGVASCLPQISASPEQISTPSTKVLFNIVFFFGGGGQGPIM